MWCSLRFLHFIVKLHSLKFISQSHFSKLQLLFFFLPKFIRFESKESVDFDSYIFDLFFLDFYWRSLFIFNQFLQKKLFNLIFDEMFFSLSGQRKALEIFFTVFDYSIVYSVSNLFCRFCCFRGCKLTFLDEIQSCRVRVYYLCESGSEIVLEDLKKNFCFYQWCGAMCNFISRRNNLEMKENKKTYSLLPGQSSSDLKSMDFY